MGTALALFFATSAIVFWALLHYFKAKKKIDPQLRFQFRVVDIWASAIGIAPSMYALVYFSKDYQSNDPVELWVASMALPLQCGGCCYGVITSEILGESSRDTPLDAAMNIIAAAIMGLGFIPLLLLAVMVVISIPIFVVSYFGWMKTVSVAFFVMLLTFLLSNLSKRMAMRGKQDNAATSSAPSPSSPPASPSDGPLGG